MSSTKFVFYGLISKQKLPPWQIPQKGGTLYSGARYVALSASCLCHNDGAHCLGGGFGGGGVLFDSFEILAVMEYTCAVHPDSMMSFFCNLTSVKWLLVGLCTA